MVRKRSVFCTLLAAAFALLLIAASGAMAADNLALTAVPTASSENPDFPATCINDGDTYMPWYPATGQEANCWVNLSWGAEAKTFSQLIIRQPNQTNYINALTVEVNVNGTYQTLKCVSSTNGTGDITVGFSPVTATDVKVTITDAVNGDWTQVGITEVEVYKLGIGIIAGVDLFIQ